MHTHWYFFLSIICSFYFLFCCWFVLWCAFIDIKWQWLVVEYCVWVLILNQGKILVGLCLKQTARIFSHWFPFKISSFENCWSEHLNLAAGMCSLCSSCRCNRSNDRTYSEGFFAFSRKAGTAFFFSFLLWFHHNDVHWIIHPYPLSPLFGL